MKWVTTIGPYTVKHRESARPSGQAYIPLENPRAFIVHTTEGTTVSGAWGTLDTKHAAPHFIIGEDQIVQCRPLDVQAATLVDGGLPWHPNSIGWQVESVGYAREALHRLTPPTWDPLVALTQFMHEHLGVPLDRPDAWTDQLPAGVWAVGDNARRNSGLAVGFHGVLGHIDIPDGNVHWDPGSLDYTALFAAVTQGDDDMSAIFDDFKAGSRAFRGGKDLPAGASEAFQFGYGVEQRIERARELPLPSAGKGITQGEADTLYSRRIHGHKVEGTAK